MGSGANGLEPRTLSIESRKGQLRVRVDESVVGFTWVCRRDDHVDEFKGHVAVQIFPVFVVLALNLEVMALEASIPRALVVH